MTNLDKITTVQNIFNRNLEDLGKIVYGYFVDKGLLRLKADLGKRINDKIRKNEVKVYSIVEGYLISIEDITNSTDISILKPKNELTLLIK